MKSRLKTALLLVLGSFLVYCAQDMAQHVTVNFDMGQSSDGSSIIGDGPVGDARAQACCDNPVPQPTVIFDETMTPANTSVYGNCLSREIDISTYRRVIAHLPGSGSACRVAVDLKHGSAAGFVELACQGSGIVSIDPQLGRTLRLRWSADGTGKCVPQPATVVGFK